MRKYSFIEYFRDKIGGSIDDTNKELMIDMWDYYGSEYIEHCMTNNLEFTNLLKDEN